MNLLRTIPWMVVLAPLVMSGILAGGVRIWGRLSAWVAMLGPLVLIGVGAASLAEGSSGSMRWLSIGDSALRLTYRVDGLSAIMLLVVGIVALCVMLFSVGYMKGDRGYVRYYAVLSMFTAAMGGLVIASDLVGIFLGWELVGACSFLLIGFWYDRPAAAEAARKAFMVTRVGDAAMLVGMGLLWRATGSLELDTVMAAVGTLTPAVVTAAAVCLLLGAVGKSAQFPLHIWLPDAMEGPTPVSALIHAATMVAAGVFLVARTWPLFEASPTALLVALVLGTVTALGAATIALPQTDIKKLLAYSTISQLGFMFAALGVGAWEVAIFHLVTHAAFKALLFLASGSVIHGSGTQDMRHMGALRSSMPITAACWIAGGLALAGIPPTAGFFSKDEVVAAVLHSAPWAGVALLAASALTGAYIARATRLAFFGDSRGEHAAHESPWTMTLPLLMLAGASLGLGLFGPAVAGVLGAESEPLALGLAAVAVGLAAAGAFAGWTLSVRSWQTESGSIAGLDRLRHAAYRGYGIDALVDAVVLRPMAYTARMADAVLDRMAIDGMAEGVAVLARRMGAALADTMSGDGRAYSALLATGVIAVLAMTIWLVR